MPAKVWDERRQNWREATSTEIENAKRRTGAMVKVVAYKTWKDTVTRLTAQSGLPGAGGKPPTIEVNADNIVTVTVYWQAPGDPAYHRYVSTTHVAR